MQVGSNGHGPLRGQPAGDTMAAGRRRAGQAALSLAVPAAPSASPQQEPLLPFGVNPAGNAY